MCELREMIEFIDANSSEQLTHVACCNITASYPDPASASFVKLYKYL